MMLPALRRAGLRALVALHLAGAWTAPPLLLLACPRERRGYGCHAHYPEGCTDCGRRVQEADRG